MEKAFKYRIYPNKAQNQILTQTFGCVRFVYNYYLNKRIEVYKTDKVSRPIQGRILSVTVSQTPSGKYYASICCTEVIQNLLLKTNKSVGCDLGIKDFLIFSDSSDSIKNSRFLEKDLKKLARLQRELSRKTINSSNWNKARVKVAKRYDKIQNKRKDFLHKLSTKINTDYDVICIENLNVSSMIKHHKLARNIADVSWSEFVRQLCYKAVWYGKQIVKVNRFFASSQICHVCGYQNPDLKDLSIRSWICPECKTLHDRDKTVQ
ncbi:RNA-guided endonuclease TnpB family protein [Hungatella hathewayi]|uniref:RNA-guided endonuclease TnpB family protein n=1 Tax=Hungatella hathewayi TaxID=154046 RepID=UPI003566C939